MIKGKTPDLQNFEVLLCGFGKDSLLEPTILESHRWLQPLKGTRKAGWVLRIAAPVDIDEEGLVCAVKRICDSEVARERRLDVEGLPEGCNDGPKPAVFPGMDALTE